MHLRPFPLALLLLALSFPARAVNTGEAADKVVGPDECGECHKNEVAVWRETPHQKAFFDLARSDEAKQIAQRMGVKRLKQDAVCTNCHFTLQATDKGHDAIAGVSCESCHSPARDWYKVHNEYGGKDVKKADETPEHRAERLARMDAAGMIRPDDIYALASNCYQCHLVLNEELVNKGEHKAGSDFELVAWSQGVVRHNFYRSEDGKTNVESSIERRRRMFAAGLALDLEYSLRAVALASAKANYAVTNAKRAATGIKKLEALNAKLNSAEFAEMIRLARAVDLKLNNADALTAAADAIGAQTRAWLAANDGSNLAALDPYLPKPDKYKGEPGVAQF